jgi:hypothetical protein
VQPTEQLFFARAHLILSNLILTHTNPCITQNKRHLQVIDCWDTQNMRGRYLDKLHGVGSRVGAAAASREEAHGGLRLRKPRLSS